MALTSVQKFLAFLSGATAPSQVSAAIVGGAANAYQIAALGAGGQLDITMMPPGVTADTAILPATEVLAAGALVNVWSNSGVSSVRNADNTSPSKPANGVVLSAVASGANATVYFNGIINGLSGLTPGNYFLGTVGGVVTTPPSAAGTIIQQVGTAISATQLQFAPQMQINN